MRILSFIKPKRYGGRLHTPTPYTNKTRLAKFKGIPKNIFYLHLKECEFRFNYRDHDIYKLILKIIRKNPIKFT